MFFSCSDQSEVLVQDEVSDEVTSQLANLGFNVDDMAPIAFEEGYLVEGDIYVSKEDSSQSHGCDTSS